MIQLSEHFTGRKLLQYTFPAIVMLVFTSIYGVVDGLFVSNYVGKTAFAAVNFILPYLLILGGFGFMFGTGGGALIAKTMGEGDREKANRIFSMVVYVSIICGIVLFIIGWIFLEPAAVMLGAEGKLLEDCIIYGRIYLLSVPANFLQCEFQSFFSTAGKPRLGLSITVAAGVTNMVLDALFVAVLPWGLAGAAAATSVSQCVGGIVPVIYFARKNTSLLRLTRTKFEGKALLRACSNGASELLNNISYSVVSMLYNAQLLKYAGEDGVAAFGVLMYVCYAFVSVFIGFSMGSAPVVSYHYGAQNQKELKNLVKRIGLIITVFSLVMFAISMIFARPLSVIFTGYDAGLLEMTLHGFKIFSYSFLFAGLSIIGSAFFTALNDGFISALISFLRTMVFQVGSVMIFPLLWGLDGIWFSLVGAEMMSAVVVLLFILGFRKKYHYL